MTSQTSTLMRHGLLLARFEFADYVRSVGAFAYTLLTPAVIFVGLAELWVPEEGHEALLPSVVGMAILAAGLFSIGVAVTEERRDGTLKTFMASPISFGAYLMGHVVSRVVTLVAGVVVLLLVAALGYGISPGATVVLFALLAALATATMLALGFLLASRARSTESAGAVGSLLFILGLLSLSIDLGGLPAWAGTVTALTPFVAMNDGLTAAWQGAEVGAALVDAAVLVVWFAGFTAAAAHWFRWTANRG